MKALAIATVFAAAALGGVSVSAGQGYSGNNDFQMFCSSCHGSTAKGDGPIATSLAKRPPDLTQLSIRNDAVFPEDKYLEDDRRQRRPFEIGHARVERSIRQVAGQCRSRGGRGPDHCARPLPGDDSGETVMLDAAVAHVRGAAVLGDPLINKGTAFCPAEREALGLDGLLPPAVLSIHQQLERVYQSFLRKETPLERYIYLIALQDRDETLFYRLLHEHIEELMPIVYTPVVGEACENFSHIYRRPRGLFISYEQRDRIEQILRNHSYPPSVIVVTDGERILGLGDQGVGGIGIPIGKLSLYTACAGIPPERTLPIVLDVGTDNEALLNDPLYLGMRHRRVRGAEYQDFIDRFVSAVMRVYPGAVLQWEDFLKENAINQLARFRGRLCTFNDDIQGTAATVLAGLYAALRLTGHSVTTQKMVLAGAGAAAQGIADLFVSALVEAGSTVEEARRRVCMVDSRGLVTRSRTGLEPFKAVYARSDDEYVPVRRRRPDAHHARRDGARVQADGPRRHFRHRGPVYRIGRARRRRGRRAAR